MNKTLLLKIDVFINIDYIIYTYIRYLYLTILTIGIGVIDKYIYNNYKRENFYTFNKNHVHCDAIGIKLLLLYDSSIIFG